MEFQSFLQKQIEAKGWSGQQFADKLDIDGGLVRAWLRGDRIPRERHEHIAKIAEILKVSQAEVEKYQIASLDRRRASDRRRQKKSQQGSSIKDLELLASRSDKISSDVYINNEIPDVIEDAKTVVKAVISMLEKLRDPKNIKSERKELLYTFQGRQSSLNQDADMSDRWVNAIQVLLEQGWKVDHLIRLDDDWERIMKIANFILNVIDKKEGYNPLVFQQKYVLEAHNGYFIIPECEALEFYTTQQSHFTDAAFYFQDSRHIKVLENHFYQLKKQTLPLFDRYKTYQQPELLQTITEADKEQGHRTVFLKRLCEITRPISWYEPNTHWAKELQNFLGYSSEQIKNHLVMRKNRLITLEKHLATGKYEFRYIYSKSFLQEFIEEGTTKKYAAYYFIATKQERLEQLENLVRLLNRYPNYQIALLEGEDNLISDRIKPTFCEVQGTHIFFMEVRTKNDRGEEESEWFVTKDPTISDAFQRYFTNLWKKIPSQQKNRYVLQWLSEQIENLKEEIK